MEAAGKRFIWHGSQSDIFRIWNLSDLHLGAKGCAEDDIRRDINKIKDDPFSFWLGGGDNAEFIGHTDKRFDPDAVADWITVKDLGDLGHKCMMRVRDLMLPIRNKCLGLLLGNHELKYELHTEQESMHHWLCQELDVPYLGYCCFFDLHFCRTARQKQPELKPSLPPRRGVNRQYGSNVFRVFAHHGAGYATTPGGKLNKLIGAMNAFDADLYFLGHCHDAVARKEPVISANADCTKLIARSRLGTIAGSYLKTYNQGTIGYGEQKMYRPTCLGAACVTIRPETRTIEAAV
jgi:hypothetical protein